MAASFQCRADFSILLIEREIQVRWLQNYATAEITQGHYAVESRDSSIRCSHVIVLDTT